MNNFKEKLSCAWIEDEDGSIDWLGSQITFKCLKKQDDKLIITPPFKGKWLIGQLLFLPVFAMYIVANCETMVTIEGTFLAIPG